MIEYNWNDELKQELVGFGKIIGKCSVHINRTRATIAGLENEATALLAKLDSRKKVEPKLNFQCVTCRYEANDCSRATTGCLSYELAK